MEHQKGQQLITLKVLKIAKKNNLKIWIGTCPGTCERTGKGQHRDTNNNDNNIFIYFINKSNEENPRTFKEKMSFLNNIQKDNKYKELTTDEEYNLRNYILTR